MIDQNVEAVRRKLAQRAEVGLQKYGVTTERDDLNTLDWLNHAQQEAMDLAVYLERLIRDETARQWDSGVVSRPMMGEASPARLQEGDWVWVAGWSDDCAIVRTKAKVVAVSPRAVHVATVAGANEHFTGASITFVDTTNEPNLWLEPYRES